MNKYVLGSVAAAAGIALLLGGAGSLALWNDDATVNAGTVNSGTLTLTSNGPGSWSEGLDFIVPGDSITYTESFTIEAVGDNLDAELSTNIAALVGSIDGVTTDVDFTVTGSSVPTLAAGVYSFNEGTYTVEVEITVDFDEDSEAGKDDTLDLGAVTISLDQV